MIPKLIPNSKLTESSRLTNSKFFIEAFESIDCDDTIYNIKDLYLLLKFIN